MKPLTRQELRREAARTFVKTCAVHVRAAACDGFYEEVAEQMYGRIGGQEVLKAATAPADSTTDHRASELGGYGGTGSRVGRGAAHRRRHSGRHDWPRHDRLAKPHNVGD
jgi:hypothetical protein